MFEPIPAPEVPKPGRYVWFRGEKGPALIEVIHFAGTPDDVRYWRYASESRLFHYARSTFEDLRPVTSDQPESS